MSVYLVTIFLGSFLLFQIQPVIGKYLLPWFGGSPAVWNACMLFFQTLLLAGYGYAHLATLTGRKKQGYLHLLLLLAALATFPIVPAVAFGRLTVPDIPVVRILLLLLATVGLPYLVLAATSPLVAHWFVRSFPGRSPYQLYALSNTGSLLALLSYPAIVEPVLTRTEQLQAWQWGFAVFALCCGWCGLQPVPGIENDERVVSALATEAAGERPAWRQLLLWLCLSACGSTLLLATTNQLCQDVAVVPYLWVIPLALYLLTYIICFHSDRLYSRAFWWPVLGISVIAAYRVLTLFPRPFFLVQIVVMAGALFAGCMTCHGELARSRPHPRHLTTYYLALSVGGALGGVFVSIIAPLVFQNFWEYPSALAGAGLLCLWAWRQEGVFARLPRWLAGSIVAGQTLLVIYTGYYIFGGRSLTVFRERNFFGVLRVSIDEDQVGRKLMESHGMVVHGWQYQDRSRRTWPTSYYGADSGAGLALRFHPLRFAPSPQQQHLRVGVIGLGVGTLATHGRPGDTFRFYEINPAVIRLADTLFSYCRESAARVEIVQGDARIMLETELRQDRPQEFDLLIVDAFSSDAIPIHLLTRECFAVYRQHLKPGGLLLVHVTNGLLDLFPVVRSVGRAAGFPVIMGFASPADDRAGVVDATWIALAADSRFIGRQEVSSRLSEYVGPDIDLEPWTDDFASLWPSVKK
jgi:hypothetical protein